MNRCSHKGADPLVYSLVRAPERWPGLALTPTPRNTRPGGLESPQYLPEDRREVIANAVLAG